MNDIAAQRQRQAVIFLSPPDPEVFADHQSFLLIRQLALVDDEPDVRRAGTDGFKNLIERHHDVIEFLRGLAQPELQSQEGAGHGPRHGDFFAGDFLRENFCLATSIGP